MGHPAAKSIYMSGSDPEYGLEMMEFHVSHLGALERMVYMAL